MAENSPLPSSQIASSSSMREQPRLSLPQLTQLQHCNNSNSALDYNTLQQQLLQLQQQLHSPTYSSLNFQNWNNTQRPGGRMNQINQQFTRYMATNSAQQRETFARRMNLGDPQINQTQRTTLQMGGGMSQTGMIGQGHRLPVLPLQAALRYNSQYQMLEQNRRNSSGQSFLGMQRPEAVGLNTQLGANGFPSRSLQGFRQWEMRRNLLSHQNLLTPSQMPPGQGLHRISALTTMSPDLSASTQTPSHIQPGQGLHRVSALATMSPNLSTSTQTPSYIPPGHGLHRVSALATMSPDLSAATQTPSHIPPGQGLYRVSPNLSASTQTPSYIPPGQGLHRVSALATMSPDLSAATQTHSHIPPGQGLQRVSALATMSPDFSASTQTPSHIPPGRGLHRVSALATMSPEFSASTQTPSHIPPGKGIHRVSALAPMSPDMSASTQTPLHIPSDQGLQRASALATVSPNFSASTQNRQSVMLQNCLSQKHLDMYQHQISQLVQQQRQLSTQQRQLQPLDLPPLSSTQQQPFPSMPGLVVRESICPTESRGGPLRSGTDSSSEGTEASSQLLGKRKIRDLAAQVDPLCKLDPEVEDMLLELADNFIDNVTASACRIAKHRKSSTLDSKDVLLHLEKNCHLTVPGHTREETKNQENSLPAIIPKKGKESVKQLLKSRNSKRGTGGAQGTI